ncbi:hypothetical protein J3458_005106 [Metarhizium acridum]|uniref:Uncharacterized protein n=1 Tax=Metarhizium acridum (strain CQMa 102) TaxID=655827 RepID=E9E1A2_METAQ|nr:uncharacterized protein MAC_03650 [Metarhizium acridum CQMa 102]EFY90404.1 hypothetical protein MAC_03650 [Metarhizium acridum CQMa 102]KAG8417612.1 hypothetical protein J3458_005106 [Metarhizium acridum]
MRFSIVSAVIASAGLVAAAPASEPGKRETNLGGLGPIAGLVGGSGSGTANGAGNGIQSGLATLFGSADAVLNTPLDFVSKLVSGDPIGAVTSAGSEAMKFAGSVPGQVAKPFTDVGSGVASDMSKTTQAATKSN